MIFVFKMTNPKLNFFIKGGKINQSLAYVWYAFVVETYNKTPILHLNKSKQDNF